MDRAQSLVRRILAFSAAACVLLAVVILRPSTTAAVRSTDDYPAAFPGFESAKAKAISVERTVKKDGKDVKEVVRLVAGAADAWTIASSHGYPAQTLRVKTFLDSIRSCRAKAEPTTVPAKFPQFGADGGFTEVRVTDAGGAALASFGIGKSGAGGAWGDVYLRIDSPTGGTGRIVTVTGFDISGNRTEVASWVDLRVFPALTASMVAEVELLQPAKSRTISLVRGKKGEKDTEEPWEMKTPEAGKAVPNNVMGLVRAFVDLSLGDVVDSATGPEADAKYGFDKPDVVATVRAEPPKDTLEGPAWKLIVGKKAEGKDVDRWYVRRSQGGKDDPYVFTVSDWALRDFRGDPSQWLEKKPEPPAEPAMTEPGMEDPAMGAAPAMGAEPAMGADPAAPPTPPAPAPVPAPVPGSGMDEKPPEPPAPAPAPGMDEKPPEPPAPAAPPAMR